MTPDAPPVILDFDDSVLPLAPNELRFDLQSWQESIRFGCTLREFARLRDFLSPMLPHEPGVTFLGSGDYHHVTVLLLDGQAVRNRAPVDLVVCDNHPDNMRYPFGIHCGSWIYHASLMEHVRHIHVVGISSSDIAGKHAWENRLTPLFQKKLTYWSVKQSARWLDVLGLSECRRNFSSPDALLSAFLPYLQRSRQVYLSLDKDVFHPEEARTNWDQGAFRREHVRSIIELCAKRLAGMDVCGEASAFRHAGWFKRFLSRLDGQETPDPSSLEAMRSAHQSLNQRILAWLEAGRR
ncbi:MAG: arginase family protein [Desulfovibrio sp.]|jgi:hypothetical protein|nr:arginase family protein [Desulfovibrio sp.]